jgi:hypothetical protein
VSDSLEEEICKTESIWYLETETDEAQDTFCNNVKAIVVSNHGLELACQGYLVPDVVLQTLHPIGPQNHPEFKCPESSR